MIDSPVTTRPAFVVRDAPLSLCAAAFRLCELRDEREMWLRLIKVVKRRSPWPGMDARYCERRAEECGSHD